MNDLGALKTFLTEGEVYPFLTKYLVGNHFNKADTTYVDDLLEKIKFPEPKKDDRYYRYWTGQYFVKLQMFGCGKYIPGRRVAKRSRFQWAIATEDLGQLLDGKIFEIPGLTISSPKAGNLKSYKYLLRTDPELYATIGLPEDVSDEELTRLGSFLIKDFPRPKR